ncbi:ABC transporter ATP-binding protein [Sulfurospirillum diekertiae]|uniref:Sulfate/thiosulfate import ATP-binding protein CysA n=1 Tax=Sulfurospirillum diekertiae TaxID=1854492 RepID=A0A1Y0HKS9_9BACT|nr:ATP-binding cassette domain-containing protein [Sulfurospirillum diekertiae]ARU48186.1 Sulfate/thiosulfate import ATP-binding protein CysA [Sulfurospirillum diekertiae]ASC93029.1 Sulfate/thiosulfate import ATP-binding protein CysA [Sulfurospirillum diekertiae]
MLKVDLSKKLQGATGVIDFEVECHFEKGVFWTIFGESGIGKTTFLRMIAGLETPDRGTIVMDDEVWFDSTKGINLTPQKRRVGFVFQNYALFEHMNVLENLLFSQPHKDVKKAEEILHVMGLEALKTRLPSTLSGGQRQRVALARSIAQEPKVLLLDEPLSSLDALTRSRLQDELKNTHDIFKLTTLMVSHDRSEVFKLSNQVLWIKEGKIFSQGSPRKVFLSQHSTSKFAFEGEVLDCEKRDSIYVATIGIGNTIVEVVLDESEAINLNIGTSVSVSTKAFAPIVKIM